VNSPLEDPGRASREQQAWDSIVADLSGQLDIPAHLNEPESTGPEPGPTVADRDAAFMDALLDDEPDDASDDNPTGSDSAQSYEPPDPGPIPVPADAISRAAWAGAIGGPILVMVAFVLGLGTFVAGIGVTAFVGGFVTLIVRLPDRDRGEDDGAVV